MINLIILACTLSLWRVSISWLCSSSTLPVSPSLSLDLFLLSLSHLDFHVIMLEFHKFRECSDMLASRCCHSGQASNTNSHGSYYCTRKKYTARFGRPVDSFKRMLHRKRRARQCFLTWQPSHWISTLIFRNIRIVSHFRPKSIGFCGMMPYSTMNCPPAPQPNLPNPR